MPAAGVVMIIAVVLIVAALVFYLVSTIVALQKITRSLDEAITGVVGIIEKSAPVNEVVTTINQNLDAGVDLLEGLLVKKAGMEDAVGLVEGLYPGSAAQGFRNFPESKTTKAPRISEVYTKGTLTLARLGREAPIAAKSPNGPALRNPAYGSLAARGLYPDARQARPQSMPRSPIIGTDSPVQYVPSESPGVRKRMPVPVGASASANVPPSQPHETEGGMAKSGLAFLRRFKKDD
ncbi:MAG TPA: hypothetical protein VFH80_16530 [Solirubrobacteraceae bacterium]|nr:hypothetical protein [Solirubrobacteraceae bacterium]